jgi:predicted AlkP superfamily pyrophosphatase or phosphodiesterase
MIMNTRSTRSVVGFGIVALSLAMIPAWTVAAPKVVLISLDGAKPELIENYLRNGVLDRNSGLGRLKRRGTVAEQNITATPSLTAVSHIAIATGSTAVHNDIPGNAYHPVAAPIGTGISGFAAPIGGYQISPISPASVPSAEPLWVQLRKAGRKVVTATWPGSDGADIRITGQLVQAAVPDRTNDYTVPFGAFGGVGAVGFQLGVANFTLGDQTLVDQLKAAGRPSFSPVQVTSSAIETIFCAGAAPATCSNFGSTTLNIRYDIKVAALDTSDDHAVNYDTLVFFNSNSGIAPGPFALPATGPAYAKADGRSAAFFFDGSGSKVGTGFFASKLAPDLSTVRVARYGANFIPRNAAVLGDVDDINSEVGFWAPQADFRIPERLSPGFTNFPDEELEAMYEDQVRSFVEYQTRIALRAMRRNPDADLVMIYIEQPDGSGHQFTITDPRQASNFLDPTSIGIPGNPMGATGQDLNKKARYDRYLKFAYQQADRAVQAILDEVGEERRGRPKSDVFVVSDHGMAPFHTAVVINRVLANAGIDLSKVSARTSGPAVNVYVNLAGREAGGTVQPADYPALVAQVADALRSARDPNAVYNPRQELLFPQVWSRPLECGRPGFCTDDNIGQDSGDVFAQLAEGYNFDGTQSPAVSRLGDTDPAVKSVYSVPNFYGAHGYDSLLPSMSAILYAAGPNIRHRENKLKVVRNIDIAPTVLKILGVAPAATVDGRIIPKILRDRENDDE